MPTDPTIIRDLARAHGLDIITDSIVINELGLDFQVAIAEAVDGGSSLPSHPT
jgi:macrolide phosphotransferase